MNLDFDNIKINIINNYANINIFNIMKSKFNY